MDIDNLTIGEAKRLAALFGNVAAAPSAQVDHGLCIVIADRGFVFVGRVTTDDQWALIKNARCVRRWGTTNGLAELAALGPLSETKLDTPADTKISLRAVIGLIPCEASKWSA